MPLYEYECEGGHEFEQLNSIDNRRNAYCPMCKRDVHLKVSAWGRVIFSSYFTVVGSNGRVLEKKQITERTPYVDSRGREF